MMLLFALAVGQILVATEKSHDPDLSKSVVLLIHSDSDGVRGLILNHPRGKLPYDGGPIPQGARALLRKQQGEAEQILPRVYMTSKTKDATARIYAGYVGWSPQQLTDEISRGLWKVVPGASSIVFDKHPETLWQRLTP
jgi:putative transcriptional regulator